MKTLLVFNPRKMKDTLHRYFALMMGQQARKTGGGAVLEQHIDATACDTGLSVGAGLL